MSNFDGTVYRPGDDGYEEARCDAVWNAIKPKRFPAAIVVAATTDDVPRAIALAREEGLTIGVRSGGHSWDGNAIREGGLLLDMSKLKAIDIDPENLTATVESGVLGGELTAALEPHNLFFPSGHCPTVGLAGFILGGGFGFNSGSVGVAAYNMYAVDVVTADGQTLHVTDEDHADILWAVRGSGPGFFAVITRMYLNLRPSFGAIASSMQMHPLEAYDELVPWFYETSKTMADSTRPLLAGVKSPIPGQDATVLIVGGYACADDLDQAKELLAPFETAPGLDRAIMHQPAAATTLEQQYALIDMQYPRGPRYLGDNGWFRPPFGEDLWRDAKPLFESLPSARSAVWLIPWKPQSHPNAAFNLQSEFSTTVFAGYDDEADDEAMLAWHADALARIEPYLIGGMANDSNLFVRPTAILTPEDAARLETLRAKYDPNGRFDGFPAALPEARL